MLADNDGPFFIGLAHMPSVPVGSVSAVGAVPVARFDWSLSAPMLGNASTATADWGVRGGFVDSRASSQFKTLRWAATLWPRGRLDPSPEACGD